MRADRVDIAVLGGGTAGAALAGLLVEDTSMTVALLEAGPDYGHFGLNGWPPELVDSSTIPATHDWNYDSGYGVPGRTIQLSRAQVIGE